MKAFIEVCKINVADVVTTSTVNNDCPVFVDGGCQGCYDD